MLPDLLKLLKFGVIVQNDELYKIQYYFSSAVNPFNNKDAKLNEVSTWRNNGRIVWRRLEPRAVLFPHVGAVRSEREQKLLSRHDTEKPVVLRLEDLVGAERLRHVLVKERRERQFRVQVVHHAFAAGFSKQHYRMVILTLKKITSIISFHFSELEN